MDKFNDLVYQLKKFKKHVRSFSENDQLQILKAYNFARNKHEGQLRDDGTSYIIHPLRVASYLVEGLNITNKEVIISALLHDVVEDTETDLEEIENKFGSQVAKYVGNLTRIKKSDETISNRYERKYKAFQETMKKDYYTRAVKSCDILDNMQSWKHIPKDHVSRKKFPRWKKEAETINLPLANSVDKRLGKQMSEELKKINFEL